jgi:hypothetical protein
MRHACWNDYYIASVDINLDTALEFLPIDGPGATKNEAR